MRPQSLRHLAPHLLALSLVAGCSAAVDDNEARAGDDGAAGRGTGGGGGVDGTLPTAGSGGSAGSEHCQQDVDIVFVMDVSTSMDEFLNKLANEISVVDKALKARALPSPPQYGLVVFVDDAELENGGAPTTDIVRLRKDFQQWASFTSSNQQVSGGSSNSTWTENSLDALYLAAKSFKWRPAETTLRAVIHTTDDTFWEGPSVRDGVSIKHNYVETVGALTDEKVRVFSFAAKFGGQSGNDDVQRGWFTGYQGRPPIPVGTDGAAYDINDILSGKASLADGIDGAIEEALCDPYDPPS